MHDAAVFAEGFVELAGGRNIDGDDEIDIVIAVGEREIILRNRLFVRSDEDFDEITLELVTEMIGFFFVEGDDEILETVGSALESGVGLEELEGVRSTAGINSGGMLLDAVKIQS